VRTILKSSAVVSLAGKLLYVSSKHEFSGRGFEQNKSFITVIRLFQTITLSTVSILLDDNNSTDQDGMIRGWLWTKICGSFF
jgi:hypothetical protein